MGNVTRLIATGVLIGAGVMGLTAAQSDNAVDLARRLQARYGAIKSFTAKFSVEQTAALMPQVSRSAGTVKVLKPNRMWWEHDKPRKFVVADGVHFWDYDVANKYALKVALPKDRSSIGVLFLAGSADLVRDFTAAIAPSSDPAQVHLVLTPKVKDPDFATLTMIVDRASLRLAGMITTDHEGGRSTYRFTNLVENVALQPGDFQLKLPKDVEIDSR